MILKDKCRQCGGQALQLFNSFECTTTGCLNFSQKLVAFLPSELKLISSVVSAAPQSPMKVTPTNGFKFAIGDKVKCITSLVRGVVVNPTTSAYGIRKYHIDVVHPGGAKQNMSYFEYEIELDVPATQVPTPTFVIGDKVKTKTGGIVGKVVNVLKGRIITFEEDARPGIKWNTFADELDLVP